MTFDQAMKQIGAEQTETVFHVNREDYPLYYSQELDMFFTEYNLGGHYQDFREQNKVLVYWETRKGSKHIWGKMVMTQQMLQDEAFIKGYLTKSRERQDRATFKQYFNS